jgi:hypothetical protein
MSLHLVSLQQQVVVLQNKQAIDQALCYDP